ncbi:uncharacterized protein YfaQ (DUF2300 family) [Xanthomonas arboricola]|uniref:hypothetical protein n=1 Tax=Xanthomonas TaxID=338 RepID=UPI0017F6C320|nr:MULTISPECIES: hypothetical protein [Xanthomonas]MBB5737644.1 uncharacterized protein YfaQ (DUF2300 family) [Xanthomonas sp. CFBP 8152]
MRRMIATGLRCRGAGCASTPPATSWITREQVEQHQIAVSKTGADTYQILKMKDDDVIVGEFWTFSADGKTLIRNGVGKSPEGKSKAYHEFFERK